MNTAITSFNTTVRHDRNVSVTKMSQQNVSAIVRFVAWCGYM